MRPVFLYILLGLHPFCWGRQNSLTARLTVVERDKKRAIFLETKMDLFWQPLNIITPRNASSLSCSMFLCIAVFLAYFFDSYAILLLVHSHTVPRIWSSTNNRKHFSGVSPLHAACLGPGLAVTIIRAATRVPMDWGRQFHLNPDELDSVVERNCTVAGTSKCPLAAGVARGSRVARSSRGSSISRGSGLRGRGNRNSRGILWQI